MQTEMRMKGVTRITPQCKWSKTHVSRVVRGERKPELVRMLAKQGVMLLPSFLNKGSTPAYLNLWVSLIGPLRIGVVSALLLVVDQPAV